jgi:hypothetical protein
VPRRLARSLVILALAGCSGSEFDAAATGGAAGTSSGGAGGSSGSTASGGTSASGGKDGGLGGKDAGSTGGGGAAAQTTLYKPSGPVGLAVDDFNLYWGSQNTKDVVYAPKDGGGTPVQVVTESTSVYYVALSAGDLYWTGTSNAVRKKSLPSGAPFELEPGLGGPLGVAVTSGRAFVAESTDSKLAVVDAVGGGEIDSYPLPSGGFPEGVATDGTTLYVALVNAGQIVSLPAAGGTPQVFANAEPNPAGIAVDADFVYWTTQASPQSLRKKAKSGGTVVVLASGLTLPTGVAVDGQYVYCADAGAGRIFRVPK